MKALSEKEIAKPKARNNGFSENQVRIRVWEPITSKQGKERANVGHASLETKYIYASIWPGEGESNRIFSTSPEHDEIEERIGDNERRTPDHIIDLFTLNTTKINIEFILLQQSDLCYHLDGQQVDFAMYTDSTLRPQLRMTNCSGLVFHLLMVGGLRKLVLPELGLQTDINNTKKLTDVVNEKIKNQDRLILRVLGVIITAPGIYQSITQHYIKHKIRHATKHRIIPDDVAALCNVALAREIKNNKPIKISKSNCMFMLHFWDKLVAAEIFKPNKQSLFVAISTQAKDEESKVIFTESSFKKMLLDSNKRNVQITHYRFIEINYKKALDYLNKKLLNANQLSHPYEAAIELINASATDNLPKLLSDSTIPLVQETLNQIAKSNQYNSLRKYQTTDTKLVAPLFAKKIRQLSVLEHEMLHAQYQTILSKISHNEIIAKKLRIYIERSLLKQLNSTNQLDEFIKINHFFKKYDDNVTPNISKAKQDLSYVRLLNAAQNKESQLVNNAKRALPNQLKILFGAFSLIMLCSGMLKPRSMLALIFLFILLPYIYKNSSKEQPNTIRLRR